MAFDQSQLLGILTALPECNRLLVAYSGGMDSHVLLHSVWSLRDELKKEIIAIHVNHGLQAEAVSWAKQCKEYCKTEKIPIIVVEVDAIADKGESPEAAARESRYQALKDQMQEGDILLTAHHSDDQAETVLLQLLRGSGPSGLSAMPIINGFGTGYHARPLLQHCRADLKKYALEKDLKWLDDFSNSDTSFDRNFLRNDVIPLLKKRWPSMDRTISRSASHCAEAQDLIEQAAREDMRGMDTGQDNRLSVLELSSIPAPRARAIVRTWVYDSGYQLPDTARLDRIIREMLNAREDRNPMVSWGDVEIRRYRDRLYLMPKLQQLDNSTNLKWEVSSSLKLPSGLGELHLEEASTGISKHTWEQGEVRVSFRSGGERCRPVGRDCRKSLKDLFQEKGIPPWERNRVPLIYINDQLAAVADLWICDNYHSDKGEPAVCVRWIR